MPTPSPSSSCRQRQSKASSSLPIIDEQTSVKGSQPKHRPKLHVRPSRLHNTTKMLMMVSVLLALLVFPLFHYVYLPSHNYLDDTITTSIGSIEMKVSCGNHRAPSCAECPKRRGADGCNGQCEWSDDGVCQSKTLLKSINVGGKDRRVEDIQQYQVPPKDLTPFGKVYLYPPPPNQSPEDLMNCAMKEIPNSLGDRFSVKIKGPGIQDSYLAEDIGEWYLHKQMKGSGVITTDISEADFFFVNTMPVLSNAVGKCNGMDHNQRQHYWKSILQKSTALKLHPRRHAFICQTWYCSAITKSLSSLIKKMTYLIHEKNTEWVAGSTRFFSSQQILVIPYVAHGDIVPFTEHIPYPRDHKVTFIGSMNRRTEWRKPLSTLEKANIHDAGMLRQNFRSSYAEEMMTSTFCLVVSGDTPSSRRLFDAMIAGCIPVFVGLEYARPFEDIIPYDLFSYRFNGTNYMNGNPQLEVDRLWSISQSEIESKRNIMSQYIKFIDWRHGNSTFEAILADMKTISIQDECDKGYLMLHPDVYKKVKEGKLESGYYHWKKYGKKEGRALHCHSWLNQGDGQVGITSYDSFYVYRGKKSPLAIQPSLHSNSSSSNLQNTAVCSPQNFLVLIKAGAKSKYQQRRQIWRDSVCPASYEKHNVSYHFLLAMPAHEIIDPNSHDQDKSSSEKEIEDMEILRREYKLYNDMVFLSMKDVYEDFHMKTLGMLEWAVGFGMKKKTSVVVLHDDEFCLRPELLQTICEDTVSSNSSLYAGREIINHQRWKTTYFQGNMYALSSDLVQDIVHDPETHFTSITKGNAEDLQVGEWVQNQADREDNSRQIKYTRQEQLIWSIQNVSCGSHHAPSCADCPQRDGANMCKGDCVWSGDRKGRDWTKFASQCLPRTDKFDASKNQRKLPRKSKFSETQLVDGIVKNWNTFKDDFCGSCRSLRSTLTCTEQVNNLVEQNATPLIVAHATVMLHTPQCRYSHQGLKKKT